MSIVRKYIEVNLEFDDFNEMQEKRSELESKGLIFVEFVTRNCFSNNATYVLKMFCLEENVNLNCEHCDSGIIKNSNK